MEVWCGLLSCATSCIEGLRIDGLAAPGLSTLISETTEESVGRIVVNPFMSLDGVVQAPDGADEDTDGGFAHGGWSHPFLQSGTVSGCTSVRRGDVTNLAPKDRSCAYYRDCGNDGDDGE